MCLIPLKYIRSKLSQSSQIDFHCTAVFARSTAELWVNFIVPSPSVLGGHPDIKMAAQVNTAQQWSGLPGTALSQSDPAWS